MRGGYSGCLLWGGEIKVRMIGDGKPTTTRTFYLHPHPNPDPGAEHIFILNHPEVRFLKGTPPTF